MRRSANEDGDEVGRLHEAEQRLLAGMRRDPADEDGGDARENEAQPQPPPLEQQPVAALARKRESAAVGRVQPSAESVAGCHPPGPHHGNSGSR
jgi:hypothetical protein